MTVATILLRVEQAERDLCVLANGAARLRTVRGFFKAVSRLGDGVFWYTLIALLPAIMGAEGFLVAAQMLATGGVGLALYRYLKQTLVRERPYVRLIGIECVLPPLDRYSFPSGHTLHAVLFTTLAVSRVPALAIILVPFAVLVAASRVILGLHYPSDVLVGAALGGGLALASNALLFAL